MIYHVGLVHGGISGNDPKRVTVQLRRDVDYLDCELWRYLGERVTTKTHYKANKTSILKLINDQEGTSFSRITID